MDILQQQLKSFFIAVLWLFWFLDINKLFKCKSSLLPIHFLLVSYLIQITKNPCSMLHLYNLCVEEYSYQKKFGSLTFFFFCLLPANTQRWKYSLYTGVYSPGWAAPLFWLLRQDVLSRETSPQGRDFSAPWKLQPPSLLGWVGITLADMGRFLSHKFHTNPFSANSSNTNTNTSFNTIQSLTLFLYRTEKALQAIVTAGIKTAHLVGMAGFGARI